MLLGRSSAQDCTQKMNITNLIPFIRPNELLVALCATNYRLANNMLTLEYDLLKVKWGNDSLKYPLISM